MPKLTLYIATSLDGYIATLEHDIGFLKQVEQEGEDHGYARFMATIDTIILGRRTYDRVGELFGTSHYDEGDKDVFVITHTERPPVGRTTFYTGELPDLVTRLKQGKGKNIYCDGGAELVNALMRSDLVDGYILSIVPVLLGNGIRLFQDGRPEQRLALLATERFSSGLVQLHYTRSAK